MEPITIGAIAGFIISGIIGNAADRVTTKQLQAGIDAWKQRQDPQHRLINHDLERAVVRSLYRAQETIAAECLQTLTGGRKWRGNPQAAREADQETVNWLQQHQKALKQQIADLDKPNTPQMPIHPSQVEELLNVQVSSIVVNDRLCDDILTVAHPQIYQKLARETLYQRVCLCFAYEIKTNDPVKRIFDSQLLVQINHTLTQMQQTTVSSEQIEAVLKQIANLPELAGKLDAIAGAVRQLGIDQEDGFEQVFGEFAKQANTLEEILALLQALAAQPRQSAEPLPTVAGLETLQSVPVWVGREAVMQELTPVLTAQPSPQVVVITGQGGMGKTSLVIKLLAAIGVEIAQRTLAESCPFGRVLGFRAEEGSSFEAFAAELLKRLGRVVPQENPTPEQWLAALLDGLSRERCLLVLDNLETLLQPSNAEAAGHCQTPEWGKFLHAIANNNHPSLVLITSRELPLDLADSRYKSAEIDPDLVYIHRLGGIDVESGVELLKRRKLPEDEAVCRQIVQKVDGHVFVLTQLAALGRKKPTGYLQQHPELITTKTEPLLREQLRRQSEPATDLLKRMAVLRYPVDVAGLTFLRLYREPSEVDDLTQSQPRRLPRWLSIFLPPTHQASLPRSSSAKAYKDLKATDTLPQEELGATEELLQQLVQSSLVQERYDKTRCQPFYDLHRVVADFLKQEYAQDQPQLLKTVYQFYRTGCTVTDPKTLDDLRPILEAQHFALQLGNYDEAFNLLDNQLWQPLYYWGYWALLRDLYSPLLPHLQDPSYYRICVQSLGCLHRDWGNWDTAEAYFQDSLNNARQNKSQRDIATSLGMLGDIERNRGNWDTAEQLYRQSLEIREALGDRSGMASSYGVLGTIERNRGHWDAAEQLYRQSLEIREALGDRSGMASSYGVLGDIERNRGHWDAAEALFRQSLEIREALGDRSGMASSYNSLGYIKNVRGDWDTAEQLYRQSLEIREALGDRSGMATSYGQLGDIERNRGNWDTAEQLYRQSLEIREALGDRAGMASSYGVLGDIERNRGNWDTAEQLYRQSLEIEEALGDRSGMASSYGVLGDIERNRGNWDTAEQLYRAC